MPTFTVLCTANAFRASAPESEAPIRAAGGVVVYSDPPGPLPPEVLIPYLRDADAVIAATDPYVGPVLAACPRLRAVVRWGTGYDTVDVVACTEHGVVACNAPGLNVEAVADHVFAVMLGMVRKLPRQVEVMRTGGWDEVRGVEVYGKTLGLVGFGAIGKAVARRARGFDCRILAADPAATPEDAARFGAELVSLERLFAEADFVSLHAALTPESRGMVGEALLRRMKPSAYFINAARGPLVDEAALLRALEEGWIAGASVDVYMDEPLPAGHALRSAPNCLATPHSAFNTVEAVAAINGAMAEQVVAVLRGETPRFVLNPEVFALPQYRGRTPLIG